MTFYGSCKASAVRAERVSCFVMGRIVGSCWGVGRNYVDVKIQAPSFGYYNSVRMFYFMLSLKAIRSIRWYLSVHGTFLE